MSRPALELAGPVELPTPLGTFHVHAFRHPRLEGEHALIVKGELARAEPTAVGSRHAGDPRPGIGGDEGPLCRVHSACLTGDVFHSLRCDCGAQFDASLAALEKAGRGVVVYLNQEGRGIGFFNKIRAYVLQDQGHDTVAANEMLGLPADARDYAAAADALKALGVTHVRLLTNNPTKVQALERAGVRVDERVPLHVDAGERASNYLKAKRDRLGHLLPR